MANQIQGSKYQNKDMLNNMKYEVAGQIGVNLKQMINLSDV